MSQSIDSWTSDHIDDDTREEWIDALRSLVREEGKQQAKLLLDRGGFGISQTKAPFSAYQNTIALEDQPAFPSNLEIEERLTSFMLMLSHPCKPSVWRAHIASYAS